MVLVIGDTDYSLSQYARSFYTDAVFIDHYTGHESCVYGSLGDVSISRMLDLMLQADRVILHNKCGRWSSSELQSYTYRLMYAFQRHISQSVIEGLDSSSVDLDCPVPVDVSTKPSIKNILARWRLDNFLGLADRRRCHDSQLWVAGCSFAHGTGLSDQTQRYGQLVADHLNLTVSFLTEPGTSIEWAADQIMRSDIQHKDILIWGITGINRASWFDNDGYTLNVLWSMISDLKINGEEQKKGSRTDFLSQLIVDDARLYLAMRHVVQVANYCNKLGIDLVLILHPYLSLEQHANNLRQFLLEFPQYLDLDSKFSERDAARRWGYVDLTPDNIHPGPMTHHEWANQLISFIKERNVYK